MPTIRIDDEVWAWLKGHAQPFEDTPNSVLRRIAGLDKPSPPQREVRQASAGNTDREVVGQHSIRKGGRFARRNMSGLTGQQLNREWDVGAHHALYHKDGYYYNHLKYFPGALFDTDGYLLFKTEKDYVSSQYLQHGKQLHVPGGISSVPGYVRKR